MKIYKDRIDGESKLETNDLCVRYLTTFNLTNVIL